MTRGGPLASGRAYSCYSSSMTDTNTDTPVQNDESSQNTSLLTPAFKVGEVGQISRGSRQTRGANARVLAVSEPHQTYAVELISDGSFHTVAFTNFKEQGPTAVTEDQIVSALNAANLYDNSHNAALLAEFEKIVPGVTQKVTLR